jgi:8-oxo-dGTP diphosphatase
VPDDVNQTEGEASRRGADAPSRLRRWALVTYAALPRPVRLTLLRTFAPTHTVGALCLLDHGGRLLMLRQHHRHGWTLPGGLIDRGEDAVQAVVREMREETGLSIEVGLPVGVVVDPRARRVDVVFHVPVEREIEVTPSSEATRAEWLTPQDAGPVDEPTAQALALFRRAGRAGAHLGRVLE